MLGKYVAQVRAKSPLVHNITNYVTVNDVANAILAVGASPIMSDEPADVEDITSICDGLNLNIGTLRMRSIEGMRRAGARARELGHAILLDPVGAGASGLRTQTATELLDTVHPTVVRGNVSEIKALVLGSTDTRGVDASAADAVTDDNLDQMVAFIESFAASTGATVAITGAIDLVADADRCYVIRNGRPEMSSITGTGCMLSGISTAFAAANPDDVTSAVAAAVAAMGLAGQIGCSHLAPYEGNATLRNRIIDALYHMDAATLDGGELVELR